MLTDITRLMGYFQWDIKWYWLISTVNFHWRRQHPGGSTQPRLKNVRCHQMSKKMSSEHEKQTRCEKRDVWRDVNTKKHSLDSEMYSTMFSKINVHIQLVSSMCVHFAGCCHVPFQSQSVFLQRKRVTEDRVKAHSTGVRDCLCRCDM